MELTSTSASATARYSPPRESTWSATSGRGSVAYTIAPRLPAVPIAARPATPAPATSTLAGATLPAAVTWPVKNRPKVCAASTTARYPAMLAIDESTSRDCAREMRGTASIDMAVIGLLPRSSTISASRRGLRSATSVAPSLSPSSCAFDGALTPKTMSADNGSPTEAPASSYASSGKLAASPAPGSTTTS